MFLKLAKNSRSADADLRESYRQRLNEIFESGRSDDGIQEPLLEPVEPVEPAAPPQMVSAPEPAGTGEDRPAPAADPLSQTAERVARSLTYGLVAILNGQERRRGVEVARLETIEEQMLAAISRIDARLDSQAEVIRELSEAINSQQNRWGEYRAAVEKLKTITDVSNLPAHLPDNL
ncbi:MAG TPA: hypothetical protein VLH09_12380 [Bryobacteraceae bacterium]|nr:hypothetical protein [Bryobacteraceae bacterium]